MKRLLLLFIVFPMFVQEIAAQCTCPNLGPELVVNGDFSNGTSGFSTTYTYATWAWPGNYGITTNGSTPNAGSWSPCTDHTTGSGNFMWVDAGPTTGSTIWQETVPVTQYTNYVFSYWFCNLNFNNFDQPGIAQFNINNTMIGNPFTAPGPDSTCIWEQRCAVWNSGNNIIAQLIISNVSTAMGGSDFGFDDISFKQCVCALPSVNAGNDATICAGGNAALSATGGVFYNWSPSTGLSNSAISNPVASPAATTSYVVTVSDSSGCSNTDTVTVTVNSFPVVAGPAQTICAGQTITLNASGGTNYSWSSGQTTSSITPAPTTNTTYSVIVSSGSCADTASVTVTVNASPVISVSGNTALCSGDIATLTASGGTNYSWNNGNTNAIINVSPTATATYTVFSSNSTCAAAATATVMVSPLPIATANNATICTGQNALLTASGGTNYSWSNGNTNSTISIAPAATSTYSVIVSVGTCADTANATVVVNAIPAAAAWNNVTITTGTVTTLGASGGGAYSWSNGAVGSSISVSPPITTVYCVTVSSNNCIDTACVTVYVEPIDCSPSGTGEIYLPNAFSPNGDGENDILEMYFGNMQCIQSFEIKIYNRWGEVVYETTGPVVQWDGTYKGKKEGTAVFDYYMKATLITGDEITKKGNISLVR